jgi:cyclic-di-GMP phosphodiesterase TipF (flagellum assembly factor)
VTASAAASARPLSYDLFLEPIVDLAEARTRHYRVHFLAGAEDGDFSMARPSAGPQVEMLAIRRALPVAEHLLGRGRDAKLFCRAGAQAFGDADFIDEMLHLAASRPKLAKRLVLELQESGLAALSADGMRGLARLASAGMSFCLSATRGRGPAAGMLTGLGFRFVMADAGFLSSGAMQEYAVGCLDGGIAVIAARVEDGHDAQTLLRDATLGFGPRFAPPRLVRKDVAPVAQSSAA